MTSCSVASANEILLEPLAFEYGAHDGRSLLAVPRHPLRHRPQLPAHGGGRRSLLDGIQHVLGQLRSCRILPWRLWLRNEAFPSHPDDLTCELIDSRPFFHQLKLGAITALLEVFDQLVGGLHHLVVQRPVDPGPSHSSNTVFPKRSSRPLLKPSRRCSFRHFFSCRAESFRAFLACRAGLTSSPSGVRW